MERWISQYFKFQNVLTLWRFFSLCKFKSSMIQIQFTRISQKGTTVFLKTLRFTKKRKKNLLPVDCRISDHSFLPVDFDDYLVFFFTILLISMTKSRHFFRFCNNDHWPIVFEEFTSLCSSTNHGPILEISKKNVNKAKSIQ